LTKSRANKETIQAKWEQLDQNKGRAIDLAKNNGEKTIWQACMVKTTQTGCLQTSILETTSQNETTQHRDRCCYGGT
jgi:Tfp pilus assembly protein PilV